MSSVTKIIIIFVAVVFSLKVKSPLGVSLFVGSIALGLWLGMPLDALGFSLVAGVFDPPNLVLLLIIAEIILLSAVMQETKQLRKMVAAVREVIRNPRFAVPTMTAIIGLLPMPGGARFSAPLVDEASQDLDTDNVHRATINYWFRHIWEYWWPFYPSVILICAITGFSIGKIVVVFFPASIVMVTVGYFFYLRRFPKFKASDVGKPKGSLLRLLSVSRAIIAVIVLNFALVQLRAGLESLGVPLQGLPTRFPLVLALIVGIMMAWRGTGLTSRAVAKMVFNMRVAMNMLTVGSILIFSRVLEDAGAIKDMTETLKSHDAPLLLLAIAVPFLVSFVTGIVVAYVGIALPILYPVFVASLPASEIPAYLFMFSVSGFIAVMLTPVHLCLILSNEYFEVRFTQVARYLIAPCALSMVIYLGIFFVYRML
ncbi:MAG: DUF401 family protein [Candidatus Coatesbacteria bacterium]|nr:DUF401 family protein [Candidatus Coatesbacteria bacterium]